MNGEELIQALKPGAQNPLAARHKNDLGRFGLGLKTASFSQCRRLSVITRKAEYVPVFWTWDLASAVIVIGFTLAELWFFNDFG